MNARRRPYWLEPGQRVEIAYVPCPRCQAMAPSMLTENGEAFGVHCPHCGLHPERITVWDDKCRTLLFTAPLTAVLLCEVAARAKSPECECSVWEGDVLVARWIPKTGMTYYAGRCGE